MPFDPYQLDARLFTTWLLLTARVIGLLATMPLIGERGVPWQVKAGMSLVIGVLLLPAAQAPATLPDRDLLVLGVYLLREVGVGILVGYLARLLFAAFQFAVNSIDFQTGLSFMQAVAPGLNTNLSVTAQFLNSLMLLLFLELDGHHVLLRVLAQTVGAVPLGQATPDAGLTEGLLRLFGVFVAVSFQIALPIVLVLLLIDVAMGVVGRVLPQLNVFMVALPVKVLIGLSTLLATLPHLSAMLGSLLQALAADGTRLVRMLAP
ncbi:MAG: flagellar biosynthetic protein FliR [Fimbriimonadaceae bacterium]|nr:flagellar biosynthetic protein FliR [Fimbriimonadaceae bacterium]